MLEKEKLEDDVPHRDGLIYHNGTGKEFPKGKGNVLLTVELEGDKCVIRNYFDGKLDESYRPTKLPQAIVDMVALMNGFQPPRGLYRRDIPSDQTQPVGAARPVFLVESSRDPQK